MSDLYDDPSDYFGFGFDPDEDVEEDIHHE